MGLEIKDCRKRTEVAFRELPERAFFMYKNNLHLKLNNMSMSNVCNINANCITHYDYDTLVEPVNIRIEIID